jgi:hypothetical protein
MATPTSYPPYQQPLLEPRTGRVSKPWHLFFLSLLSSSARVDAGLLVPPGEDGDVLYNDDGTLAAQPVQAFGYWTPITNGDPLSPEILFDAEGDCVVGFVPTPS